MPKLLTDDAASRRHTVNLHELFGRGIDHGRFPARRRRAGSPSLMACCSYQINSARLFRDVCP